MELIITEKPSVAKDIAEAVGATVKGDGFLKNDQYTITWAFGHLLQLDPALMPTGNPWSYSNLPVLPETFNYVTDKSTGKQFRIIKDLLKIANGVIIATDAGREGELIARLILNQAGWKNWNNTKRFWSSEALSKPVVLKSLNSLQPSNKFDSLYYSALTRQHADWLCGINLTQAVTIQSGGHNVWSVGRVQTPTLRLIVDRDNIRLAFKPVQYFVLKATFSFEDKTYEGLYFKEKDTEINNTNKEDEEVEPGTKLNKSLAESVINYLFDSQEGIISSLNTEKKSEKPPLLHSLTSLQREGNQVFGLTAQKTLDIAQGLYEKHKCLSYPRTDSQHMAESSKDLVHSVLQKLNRAVLQPAIDKVGERVFNDIKLTDHHAIIPLSVMPEGLTKDEQNVYNLVYRKFIGAFMPNYEYETTELITSIKDCLFKTNGKITINSGWKSLYNNEEKALLPNVREGYKVKKQKLDVVEKFTKPQAAFTEDSLLAIMERLNLGTPATRADIIEKLIFRGYIGRDKKNLLSTGKGKELILKAAGRKFIDPELTAQWEVKLDSIITDNTGINGYNSFVAQTKLFVTEEIENIKQLNIISVSQATPGMIKFAKELATKHKQKLESLEFDYIKSFIDKFKEETLDLGKCACGKGITERQKSYNCECGKLVWKEVFNKKINSKIAEGLMNGKVVEIKGCSGKNGKFDAKVKLAADNKLEFVK